MALPFFHDEDLNYFKFMSLVVNEFPNALRQTFKKMWDHRYGHRAGFQLWDDSTAVRNLFAVTEGGKTRVPVHRSFHEWDYVSLVQSTILSRTFAVDGKTLREIWVKPRGYKSNGQFHSSVVSVAGNNAETWTLAIDQLRLLRNSIVHVNSSKMKKETFDQYLKHAKDAFQALGVSTDAIDAIVSLSEAEDVAMSTQKLDETIQIVSGSKEDIADMSTQKEGELKSVNGSAWCHLQCLVKDWSTFTLAN